ncbi:MAG: hypothetical protein QNJ46_12705 [Leptolyngbyaceae cyanobacterium MO_188.B28]|nr:hypothetical protein [Leptolyngbyaceae cyanobacterium MO_188.B28]
MTRNEQAAIQIGRIEETLNQMRSGGITDQNLSLLHEQALELQQIANGPVRVTTEEFYAHMRSALNRQEGIPQTN